jgi:glutaredoxin-related protein
MTRVTLSNDQLLPEAAKTIGSFHADVVKEVSTTVSTNKVVVVGMAHNPFVGKARKALHEAGIPFTYLQYGSYFGGWKKRLAIKLWSGWATYPQVFVEGKLVGGYTDLAHQLKAGKIKA